MNRGGEQENLRVASHVKWAAGYGKGLDGLCGNLSDSFPGEFAFGPSPLPKRRTSKRANLLLMQRLPLNRWRFLEVHTKSAVWADHEKS
jgi:hypothetical protein